MRFIFTGTGTSQGVPVIACTCPVCRSEDSRDKRLRTAGLLCSDTATLAIDAGPDFRQQMLRHEVRHLDAVILTHSHKDHVGGLDDVRPYNYLQQRDMPVYGSRATLDHLHREYYYIFERPDYPGIPKLLLHEIGEAPFEAAGIALQPVPVWHSKMPVLGFRTGNFAYITDASHIPETSMQLLGGVKILVINALRIEPHYSHFNLEQALAVAEAIGPDQAWFTHISHLMGRHADVSARLPGWAQLAWDGLELHWEA